MRRLAAALAALLLAGGCATYPKNPELARYDPGAGYRFANLKAPANSESLFVILTFSGGGTRAAALSYGVLEKLRGLTIRWEGRERRLLDEVDVISSVSGGSFTSAYYALFREETFDPGKYEKVFLYRDVEAELLGLVLNPINWLRLASPTFGRIDLAAEFYDREIFRRRTYADLVRQARRPYLLVNATDITMGASFPFTQDQFDLICSDLAGFPVGRAVAASSNFPIAFTPMTVNNYAGACGFREPGWFKTAARDLDANPVRFNRYRIARSYLDAGERPYLHLLDGGVADNIGLRNPLAAVTSNDLSWSLPNRINQGKIKKAVVIVVDARTDPKTSIDRTPAPPGLPAIVDIIASVPMGNYSFDTVQLLLNTFEQWDKDRAAYRGCQAILGRACGAKMPTPPPRPVELYGVYVGFDQIADEKERRYFLDLPTTFSLSREQVDRLRAAGPAILDRSETFQELLKSLR